MNPEKGMLKAWSQKPEKKESAETIRAKQAIDDCLVRLTEEINSK